MGYRLEVYKLEHAESGGKLFGYISDEELHTCKSWKWLKDKGLLEEGLEDAWCYGITHAQDLFHDDYLEFIKLYIEDYNRLSPFGSHLTLEDFSKSLAAGEVALYWE